MHPVPEIRICPGCGVIAPLARTDCSVCKTPFGAAPVLASPRIGTMVLACVHSADFACKACGIRSPVATVDCGGEIECMGCGLRQAFDAEQWRDALAFAHGVVDLAGPHLDAVSSRSRHAKMGTEHTTSTKTQNTMIMDARGQRNYTLKTAVSPGHPLCRACKAPLEVAVQATSALSTRCPRCNDVATYGLPPNARETYGALVGIVAAEQRTDKPLAKLGRTQAGVESIVCPQCGAGIDAGQGSELVTCTYCRLAVRIPGTLARQQRRGAMPVMDPFWLVFDGPSIGRQRLSRGKSEDPDDGDDDDDDEVARAPVPHGIPANSGWGANPTYGAPPPKKSGAGIVIAMVVVVLLLGLLVVGGGVAFWFLSSDQPTKPVRAIDPAKAAPAPTAKPRR